MNARETRGPGGRGSRGGKGGKGGGRGGKGGGGDKMTVGEMMGCGLFLVGCLLTGFGATFCALVAMHG